MSNRPPLPFPAQRKVRPPKLRPHTKDCPRCENMLHRRCYVVDSLDGRGCYDTLPSEQCTHRGRAYKLNGLLTIVLCICCLNRLVKKSNVSARLVRPTRKARDAKEDSLPNLQRTDVRGIERLP